MTRIGIELPKNRDRPRILSARSSDGVAKLADWGLEWFFPANCYSKVSATLFPPGE
jgi:hypothetical protein